MGAVHPIFFFTLIVIGLQYMGFVQELLTVVNRVIKGSLSTFQAAAHVSQPQEGHQNSLWLEQVGVEAAGQT